MIIKEYKDTDLHEIAELYIDAFSKPPWNERWEKKWVLDRIQWLTSISTFKGLIAKNENEIVGVILGKGIPFRGKMEFEIVELLVATSDQRKGVGKALIRTLEAELKDMGYTQTTLITAKGIQPGMFYEALGYSINDEHSFMYHQL